jgi:homotetrameric cytidine deaminase
VVDDDHALRHGAKIAASTWLGRVRADRYIRQPLTAPRRNIEIKARLADPERALERALGLGADDKGEISQRDTYFARARGRLKLREQEPGEDELIQYRRADEPGARASSYRRVPAGAAAGLRDALDAALGTLVVVEKRRRLLLLDGVRIHLDEVEGLGSYLELEAVASDGADLDEQRSKVSRLRAELGIAEDTLVGESYSDLLMDSPELLLRAAAEAMERAYAPYSNFKVGAALRAESGGIYTGANVENASYPQGQCAETSAIGALVAAGETRIAAVAVTAERMDLCPPCGGCRQRLSELAGPDTPVYLGRPGGPLETTTVGSLLPLAFDLERP